MFVFINSDTTNRSILLILLQVVLREVVLILFWLVLVVLTIYDCQHCTIIVIHDTSIKIIPFSLLYIETQLLLLLYLSQLNHLDEALVHLQQKYLVLIWTVNQSLIATHLIVNISACVQHFPRKLLFHYITTSQYMHLKLILYIFLLTKLVSLHTLGKQPYFLSN